jgi:serine/threonine protein kinase
LQAVRPSRSARLARWDRLPPFPRSHDGTGERRNDSARFFVGGSSHRDLKPSNLFLVQRDILQVKILDFGIARRFALSRPVTRTGMIIGTPEYMAPEQARGQRDIGPSADIFALGCVLFECLLGEPPFVADHIAAVLAKILFEDPPSMRSLKDRVPERVALLLSRMLAKVKPLRSCARCGCALLRSG